MDNFQILSGFLSVLFYDNWYVDAILKIRSSIKNDPAERHYWEKIVSIVQNRLLSPGQPLELVNHKAGQILYENTDEEAYVWLNKMIQNVERDDDGLDPYIKPEDDHTGEFKRYR